jgi:exopolyphosphatase / guanosine-5'-triphosphate,3'-diphosphate pyrophosphatase
MKIASLDIGTNTCNLLIAEHKNNSIDFLHKEKRAITLINKDYINNNISGDSILHLVNVLNDYKKTITFHDVETIVATATSGIRSAANRKFVVDTLESKTGIKVSVIEGDKEAELAWIGVRNAISLDENPVLVIDIGGGSIEFIIGNKNGIIWKKSYNIGVARLMSLNNFSDPLKLHDIETIKSILKFELEDLLLECRKNVVEILIGSSGSYETFANLVKFECADCIIADNSPANTIDICRFIQIYNKLVSFDFEQRKAMQGMEIIRVKMIPIAAVITKFLLEELKISKFIQSNFSIKEGSLFDYIEKNH